MKTFDAFLAVSYKPACVSGSEYRHTIESLVDLAIVADLSIYVAPLEEQWGQVSPTRRQAISCDHMAMQSCRVFVFFIGGFESDGALVELGMALALKRQILILHFEKEVLSSHVQGLIEIGLAREIVLKSDVSLQTVASIIISCRDIVGQRLTEMIVA